VRDRSIAAYLITTTSDRGNHASPRSRTGCAPTTSERGLQLHNAMCREAARASTQPLCGGEGRTIRPRRGARHGCRALFVRAGARSKSPAAPHELAGRSPDSATRGALSFGYFSLSKQRKVTRPSAEGRKPAAGEPSCRIATTSNRISRRLVRSTFRPFCVLRPTRGRECRTPRRAIAHSVRSYKVAGPSGAEALASRASRTVRSNLSVEMGLSTWNRCSITGSSSMSGGASGRASRITARR